MTKLGRRSPSELLLRIRHRPLHRFERDEMNIAYLSNPGYVNPMLKLNVPDQRAFVISVMLHFLQTETYISMRRNVMRYRNDQQQVPTRGQPT